MVSPTLKHNSSEAGIVTVEPLPPTAASSGISSFFKKGTALAVITPPKTTGKAPAHAPAAPAKAKATTQLVAMPSRQLGPTFYTGTVNEGVMESALSKLFLKRYDHAGQVLTAELRDAPTTILPVVLNFCQNDAVWHGHVALILKQEGRMFIVSEAPRHLRTCAGTWAVSASKPFTGEEVAAAFSGMSCGSPMHPVLANPQIASILWSALATFRNLKWELYNVHDMTTLFANADTHYVVQSLPLTPAPKHVMMDYEQLIAANVHGVARVPRPENKELLKQDLNNWIEKGTHWTPPEGKWPSYPVAIHDPRAVKLGSRADLVAAVMAVVRAPAMAVRSAAFANCSLADGIVILASVKSAATVQQASTRRLSTVEEDEEDEEERASRAMFAPPPPKQPALKVRLGSTAARFVKGARSALCSDDDSMDDDEESGEQDGLSAEESFLASDDDIEEAGSTTSARNARAKKESKKRKERWQKDVVSPSVADETKKRKKGEDSDTTSSSAEETGSGSDTGSSDEDEDDEDDILVKHKKDASDAEDVNSGDDEDVPRLMKTANRGKNLAVPPKKKELTDRSTLPYRHPVARNVASEAPKVLGVPAHPNRDPRDLMHQRRVDKHSSWKKIDRRVTKLLTSHLVGSDTNLGENGSVIAIVPGNEAALLDCVAVAGRKYEHLVTDNTIANSWHPTVAASLTVIESLLGIIEAADADEKTRKKHDTANAALGTIAAQSMLKVVPQIEELQKTITTAATQINTLVGTSAGMASRLAMATAKKAASEDK